MNGFVESEIIDTTEEREMGGWSGANDRQGLPFQLASPPFITYFGTLGFCLAADGFFSSLN